MGSPIETPASGTPEVSIGTDVLGQVQGAVVKPYDRDFIDAMVPRLQAEMAMARVALTRAQHQQLRDVAQQMIDGDSTDVAEMQLWRQSWFGSSSTPSPDFHEVDALKAVAEPSFDRAFLDAVLPLQQQVMDQAREALLQAGAQEILDTAGELLADHSRYALQMQGWREQW